MLSDKINVRTITSMGMLLCLAIVLSFLEGMIPPLPALPPGVKLGLSNIVVIYCIFFLNAKKAFGIVVLKSFFVFLTRGVSAGLISICGGLLSVLIMVIALHSKKFSILIISIFGAVSHNVGQLFASSLLLQSNTVFYYLPILIISGVLMGTLTATFTKMVLPVLKKISGKKE
ncbi:MAG: Gx transporter family protein [Oscillospiraceae bacterium]